MRLGSRVNRKQNSSSFVAYNGEFNNCINSCCEWRDYLESVFFDKNWKNHSEISGDHRSRSCESMNDANEKVE